MKKITKIFALLLVVMSVLMIVPTDSISAKTKQKDAPNPKLNTTFKDMLVGETFKLKLKNAPDKSITYESSNKKVAKISSKGKITAKKAGTAIITVKCGDKTYKCGIVVFKKNDTIYSLRKEATGMRDNFSLLALRLTKDYNSWQYTPDKYDQATEDYTVKYGCYEIKKRLSDNSYDGDYGYTFAMVDFVQTRENLLSTGLFEECEYFLKDENGERIEGDGGYFICYPFYVKPKKPFVYNGKTYNYIAEYNGYYISCLSGAIYDEFSEESYNTTMYDVHFRNKSTEIFGRYEKDGKAVYKFFSGTTLREKGTKWEKYAYCAENGNTDNYNYTFNGVIDGVRLVRETEMRIGNPLKK